jgi:hypothetical protein
MPRTSTVAPRLLGEIYNAVGRCDIDQIFLCAKTKTVRVLAIGVEPSRGHDVTKVFKILAELPQRESF